jgi:hypothetical protein
MSRSLLLKGLQRLKLQERSEKIEAELLKERRS